MNVTCHGNIVTCYLVMELYTPSHGSTQCT